MVQEGPLLSPTSRPIAPCALRCQMPPLIKVRTVTTGITLSSDSSGWDATVAQAASVNSFARSRLEAAGFEVQTTRVSSNPFEEWIDAASPDAGLESFRQLDASLQRHGIGLFSAGPASTAAGVALAVAMVKMSPRMSASAAVGPADGAAALCAANAILRIAHETEGGEGNFQFCAAFDVPPGVPFFPAAYHAGEPTFALGCETPEALAAAFSAAGGDLAKATQLLKATLEEQMRPLESLGKQIAAETGVPFAGIDASIAPSPGTTPLTDSFEALGLGTFGSSGTLAACAAATAALKTLDLKTVGYSGLMLPPLEDAGLAKRANERAYRIHDLLCYSAVCGLGLDTVPIPGDISAAKLAALLLDVAALAHRYNKPLSARLFPVPSGKAGDMTNFKNPFLCNACIFELP
mmetsp:Transcript_115268/g.336993  ORF Transcript_115268/g.336993 Transcript_115268/m.336993 type:complete len:408 (+) Transcript_115268:2-1225(+)